MASRLWFPQVDVAMPFLDANALQDDADGLGFLRDVLRPAGERPILSERFEPRTEAAPSVGASFTERRPEVGMAEALI